MRIILCACLVVGSLTACAPNESEDQSALQGVWIPVKAELGGKPMSDAVLEKISLTLSKNDYEALVAGEADKGTWTIDPAAKPKGIEITGVNGPNAGKTFPAIY